MKIDVTKRKFRADRFREVMDAHGATVDDIVEIAKRATTSGFYLNADNYRKIASGEIYPGIAALIYICEAVNVSADYLLGLSEKVN